jgi:hypothetical protein
MRTYNAPVVKKAVEVIIDPFDAEEWLAADENVALTNESGDHAIFERFYDNQTAVFGHYFFVSRGRAAIEAGKQFLAEIFTGPYNVHTVMGLTPVEHKAALWMNRQLGFKETGEVLPHRLGDVKMVILTKEEWSNS